MPIASRRLALLLTPRQRQLPGMARAQMLGRARAFFKHQAWASPASAFFSSIRKTLENKPSTPSRDRDLADLRIFERLLSFPVAVANHVWQYLWALAFVASSIVLIAWATGGLDRLVPVALGSGAITPGSPTTEWFTPAPSAFVQHATREDGSFDLELLRTRLRDAGVNPGTAILITHQAATSYQNLLLVDDPQVRKEMLARSQDSNVELEEAFGELDEDQSQILKALDERRFTHQSSAADAIHWKALKNIKIEDFMTNIGSPGVKSLPDRFNHIKQYNDLASASGMPAWPISQVVAIGIGPNGDWDGALLANRMRDAGIHHEVAQTMLMEVEQHLAPASSLPVVVPVAGSHTPSPLEVIGEAYKTALNLDREYEQLFRAPRIATRQVQFRGFDDALTGVPEHLRRHTELQLQWEDRQWAKIINDMARGYTPASAPAGLDMAAARAELARVARRVGLRSLSLTNASFSSPENIWEIAKGLERANAEIEAATGWRGPVLGLGGRVDLALRTPIHINAMGAVLHAGDGRITMATGWPALGHEWFHALDMAAGQHALDVPLIRGLSSSEHNQRYARLPELVDASFQLNKDLHETPSAWRDARTEGDKFLATRYFTDNAEMTASAFASWLSDKPQTLMLGTRHVELERIQSPHYVLDSAQFESLSPRFERYFRAMDGMDWTGRPGPASTRVHEPSIVMEWFGEDMRKMLGL